MGIENYRKQIDEIHLEYINELKPLIAMVEHNYRKFPIGILKEFRDVFDHISRLYIDGKSDDYYRVNLEKTTNHFDRLKLDVYKYVCDLTKKHIDKWVNRYSKYDMSCIDNGDFWKKVTEDFDACEEHFYYGQREEHLNIKQACDHYMQYVTQCDEVFQYIKSKSEYIRKIKYKYCKTAVKGIIGGLILGIVGSIIASMLWTGVFEPVFKEDEPNTTPVNSTIQTTITEKDTTQK